MGAADGRVVSVGDPDSVRAGPRFGQHSARRIDFQRVSRCRFAFAADIGTAHRYIRRDRNGERQARCTPSHRFSGRRCGHE